ncbi:large ATP-binding protein [Arthrobacter sp. ZXY-2]|uniref:Large ATP-binding protein n=1 Tax=Paenarthrobacter aurescens (strain TC1) TaxID=290340 RepID=A1RCK0_PAEAT|nr:putative Large ATP-binding protein [Paenarthrobacter aurescens TC1]AOY73581.1 large ATP-binding protein [Arthrobacter sp. ZXY-2]
MASSGSYQYLYERLGDKRFQQLCAALVLDRYPNVSVFPVGEKDGGRDMVSGTGENRTILQVKWSGNRAKKSASWLKSAVNGEAANIKRLVAEGCKQYVLMTNVEGSAAPGSGTRDQIEKVLDDLGKQYGIPMSCVWAADLDAWVTNSPWEIRATYLEMLAGSDLLLALLDAKSLEERERRERDILVTFVATHWDRDKRVKFRQVDLASDLLTDLFVDVTAHRARSPRNTTLPSIDIGGLAHHLLDPAAPPLALIEGVPGQGKSTIAQYVCQVHRAGFIGRDQLADRKESLPADEAAELRVAIRIDLADYAEWIGGHDPYASTDSAKKPRQRTKIGLERFLVAHFEHAAPGHELGVDDVRAILDRFPTQVFLDGLDEVASASLRETVVREIDEFTSRWAQARPGNMRIVVTTRPNASGLAEPAPDIFERLVLQPLSEATKKRYLRRWAAAQHIDGSDRRTLERVFGERTAAPHVAQLAANPMQLTILLHLIRTKGESLPTARTSLYRSYMDLFLERESTKSKTVLDNRPDLEEATSFIGWLMQALTEVDASSTRLPAQRIVREIRMYLAGVEKTNSPVQDLFDAMRDRVWVLTSKQSGTYEFDVQSIREFFAARFLYEFAEGDEQGYEPEAALVELLPRAYWANTARFLGGHFQRREVPSLAEAIEERFKDLTGARQLRTTVWSLLCDGIFTERTASQRRVAELFADDLSVRFLAPEVSEGGSLPELPADFGGRDLAGRLREAITRDVGSPLTRARATVAAAVGDPGDFNIWWSSEVGKSVGTDREAQWLAVGRPLASGQGLPRTTVEALRLDSAAAARGALESGVSPADGTHQAQRLLAWTLDGHCSDVAPKGTSEAADLLRVVAPHVLLAMASDQSAAGPLNLGGHHVPGVSQSHRTAALKRLAERHGSDLVQSSLRIKKGESGTTSRWVNTARALTDVYGRPTWLATEIAAVAAALPEAKVRTGGNRTKDAPCFGSDMDYGQWLPAIRVNRGRRGWWTEQLTCCTEPHAKATWVIGLLVAGDEAVISALLDTIAHSARDLPAEYLEALVASSSRIAASGIARAVTLTNIPDETDPVVRLLLAHYAKDPAPVLGEDPEVIRRIARFPVGGWPAARLAADLTASAPTAESLALVEEFGVGPTEPLAIHFDLPRDSAEHVLANPARYTTPWLAAADRSLYNGVYDRPLKTHADTNWGI